MRCCNEARIIPTVCILVVISSPDFVPSAHPVIYTPPPIRAYLVWGDVHSMTVETVVFAISRAILLLSW